MMTNKDKPEGRMKAKLLSFQQGMSHLPKSLAKTLGDRIKLSEPVVRLEKTNSGWSVISEASSYQCNQVVLATPAQAVAKLMTPFDEAASEALQAIPYLPVAVVHLAFPREAVTHPLDGFGCLIPRKEQIQTLGSLFSSTLFPGRCGEQQVLITCFIGGATFNQIRDWQDQQVLDQVLADVKALLDTKGDPVFSNLVRWNKAIPQYTMGHFDRLQIIEDAVNKLGGLHTRANWRDGISVPDCIQNAQQLGRTLASANVQHQA